MSFPATGEIPDLRVIIMYETSEVTFSDGTTLAEAVTKYPAFDIASLPFKIAKMQFEDTGEKGEPKAIAERIVKQLEDGGVSARVKGAGYVEIRTT